MRLRSNSHFHRDIALEPSVVRSIHPAHAARAEERVDFIRAEAST
jgi:hypothetical protein